MLVYPYQVASYVHECLEYRRYAETELLPHFSVEDMGGSVANVWDTFSSDLALDSGEDTPSTGGNYGVVAHGAVFGSTTGAPL